MTLRTHPTVRTGTATRRTLSLLTLLVLAMARAALAQSDTAATTPAVSELRTSQWAALFEISGGTYGMGALYFTSPGKAWLLNAEVVLGYQDSDGGTDTDEEELNVTVGRRWYGAERTRVRSILGAGLFANYFRRGFDTGDPYKSYSGGVYGELGGAVFFTPDLSLGAAWMATLGAGTDSNSEVDRYQLNAGNVRLEGAFYF